MKEVLADIMGVTGQKKLTASDIPAGWFEANVPEVDDGMEAYYWAWLVNKRLDVDGNIITELKPEIVRVVGAEEECDREICRTGLKYHYDPASYRALPANTVLWKGPLHYQ